MNKIIVTGGTGTLGREIVRQLLEQHYPVTILTSRRKPDVPLGADIAAADVTDKTSLNNTIAGTNILIHCASNAQNFRAVDIEGTKNLLAALRKKHFLHFIYISIAGVERSRYPYYLAKRETEEIIRQSGFPFSIVRATQFHNFVLERIIKPSESENSSILSVPKGLRFQSIDSKDVADKTIELMKNSPTNSIITIAGPEILTIEEMAQTYLNISRWNGKVHPIENDMYSLFKTGVNLYPEFAAGKITWEQFLRNRKI